MDTFKKVTIVVALMLGLAASANAQITTGQTMYMQRHSYWNSFLLLLKSSVSTRASTLSAGGTGGALAFDFIPPECSPAMKIITPIGSAATQDLNSTNVVLSARTDSGTRFELPAELYASMGDTDAMFTVRSNSTLLAAIGEMSRGQVLRMKSSYGWDPNGGGYDTFSMVGMTAAFRRAYEMCSDPAKYIRR